MTSCKQYWLTVQVILKHCQVLLIFTAPVTSYDPGMQSVESYNCYGIEDCAQHDLNCLSSERLAITEAFYGYQTLIKYDKCSNSVSQCLAECCRFNITTDCKENYSKGNLYSVQTDCSTKDSCVIPAQRSENGCNQLNYSTGSTTSVLKALCVPETITIHPCSDLNVTGRFLSLLHTSPPTYGDMNCTCRLDPATNNHSSHTNATNIQISVYDIMTSNDIMTSSWIMEVYSVSGPTLKRYTSNQIVFPTVIEMTASLPVGVRFDSASVPPEHVWLGFQAVEDINVTLRCGQAVKNYELFLESAETTTARNSTVREMATVITTPSTEKPQATNTPDPIIPTASLPGTVTMTTVMTTVNTRKPSSATTVTMTTVLTTTVNTRKASSATGEEVNTAYSPTNVGEVNTTYSPTNVEENTTYSPTYLISTFTKISGAKFDCGGTRENPVVLMVVGISLGCIVGVAILFAIFNRIRKKCQVSFCLEDGVAGRDRSNTAPSDDSGKSVSNGSTTPCHGSNGLVNYDDVPKRHIDKITPYPAQCSSFILKQYRLRCRLLERNRMSNLEKIPETDGKTNHQHSSHVTSGEPDF